MKSVPCLTRGMATIGLALSGAGLPPAADPVAIRVDSLPPDRWWRGQRQVEKRDHLSFASAATDRHDLIGVVEIHNAWNGPGLVRMGASHDLSSPTDARGHACAEFLPAHADVVHAASLSVL